MTMKEKFARFANWIENLFMTNHACLGCGREIVDGTKFQLCENCVKDIEKLSEPLCEKCGDKVLEGNKFCDHCKSNDYYFDCNKSICYYTDVSAKIVKGLKYGRRKYYAKHIADIMTSEKDVFEGVDVITYVPVTSKTRRERGFNQAEEIAREISNIVGIEMVCTLSKSDDTKHQAGLSQKERLENLKDSFLLINDAKDKIKGKVVLIVDDVFTTGTTLSECAKALKKAKPAKVKTITFAKTKFEH